MSNGPKCPECGTGLTEEQARGGECPACAVRMALGDGTTDPTLPAAASPESPEPAPERIGPYRVIRTLGEGGMGEVFLAEQQEPVHRQVAVKVIKRGLDTKHVVSRFEAERQALARMDHPSIAKVYDAGVTEDGRPYFVMEYVEGDPITEFADRRRLTIRERLELFRKVCAGVQHAHQKGVIHRDLKPSNILVTDQDGEAAPRIIDFGVAKAVEKRLTEESIFTEIGIMIGTPEYMSPEQAEVSAFDVDTRTDVYSLGVVLYELLTGFLPFDSKELRRAGYEEIRRRIREEDPAKPSSRVSTLGGQASGAAERRRSNVTSFRRELSGDLDWIAMKALEKKPIRRYESPLGLADDIGRHLSNLPVVARPPSSFYLATKFARRHRVAVLVTLALVAALIFSVVQSQRGRRLAERTRDESEAVSRFLADTLQLADPSRSGGHLTVKEAIDRATPAIERRFGDRPLVQARLFYVVGEVYTRLGEYDEAREALERSLEIRLQELGENHETTAETLNMLGILFKNLGEYPRSETMYERALEARRATLGSHDPLVGETLNNLAVVYQMMGRFDEAKEYLELSLEIRKRELGPRHEMVGRSLANIGALHFRKDEYEEALDYFQQALEVQEAALGENHPGLIPTLSNIGVVYDALGDAEGAVATLEQALTVREAAFGADNPEVAVTLLGLGEAYKNAGRTAEAEEAFLRVISVCEAKLDPDHERTSYARMDLGALYVQTGRFDEAVAVLQLAVASDERRAGPRDVSLLEPLYHLADAQRSGGDSVSARETIRRAESIGVETLDEDDPGLASIRELRAAIEGVD